MDERINNLINNIKLTPITEETIKKIALEVGLSVIEQIFNNVDSGGHLYQVVIMGYKKYNKITMIKIIRAISSYGLKEGKEYYESKEHLVNNMPMPARHNFDDAYKICLKLNTMSVEAMPHRSVESLRTMLLDEVMCNLSKTNIIY